MWVHTTHAHAAVQARKHARQARGASRLLGRPHIAQRRQRRSRAAVGPHLFHIRAPFLHVLFQLGQCEAVPALRPHACEGGTRHASQTRRHASAHGRPACMASPSCMRPRGAPCRAREALHVEPSTQGMFFYPALAAHLLVKGWAALSTSMFDPTRACATMWSRNESASIPLRDAYGSASEVLVRSGCAGHSCAVQRR